MLSDERLLEMYKGRTDLVSEEKKLVERLKTRITSRKMPSKRFLAHLTSRFIRLAKE